MVASHSNWCRGRSLRHLPAKPYQIRSIKQNRIPTCEVYLESQFRKRSQTMASTTQEKARKQHLSQTVKWICAEISMNLLAPQDTEQQHESYSSRFMVLVQEGLPLVDVYFSDRHRYRERMTIQAFRDRMACDDRFLSSKKFWKDHPELKDLSLLVIPPAHLSSDECKGDGFEIGDLDDDVPPFHLDLTPTNIKNIAEEIIDEGKLNSPVDLYDFLTSDFLYIWGLMFDWSLIIQSIYIELITSQRTAWYVQHSMAYWKSTNHTTVLGLDLATVTGLAVCPVQTWELTASNERVDSLS